MEQEFAKAYYNRGLAYLDLNNPDQAIVDFTKAIEYTPEWVTEVLDRNPTSVATGEARQQAGFTSFLDFTQSYANLTLVYMQRGYAYLSKGEFKLAVADLKKALELGPDLETKGKVETLLNLAISQQVGTSSVETTSGNENLIPTEAAEVNLIQETIAPPWAEVSTSYMQEGGAIVALVIDPLVPTTLYAGVFGGGVDKSTDGGENWRSVNAGLPLDVSSLAIDPVTPTTLYVATLTSPGSIFKSTNGGESWTNVYIGLTTGIVSKLAIDPLTPTNLYAGTEDDGIYKSTDGGESWSAINNGLTVYNVLALAIDPLTPTILYARTRDGSIFKSTNGGENWNASYSILPDGKVSILAIDPGTPTTLYAGTLAGIFRSTDGGDYWTLLKKGWADEQVTALAIDLKSPTTLYTGIWNRRMNGRSCKYELEWRRELERSLLQSSQYPRQRPGDRPYAAAYPVYGNIGWHIQKRQRR